MAEDTVKDALIEDAHSDTDADDEDDKNRIRLNRIKIVYGQGGFLGRAAGSHGNSKHLLHVPALS